MPLPLRRCPNPCWRTCRLARLRPKRQLAVISSRNSTCRSAASGAHRLQLGAALAGPRLAWSSMMAAHASWRCTKLGTLPRLQGRDWGSGSSSDFHWRCKKVAWHAQLSADHCSLPPRLRRDVPREHHPRVAPVGCNCRRQRPDALLLVKTHAHGTVGLFVPASLRTRVQRAVDTCAAALSARMLCVASAVEPMRAPDVLRS